MGCKRSPILKSNLARVMLVKSFSYIFLATGIDSVSKLQTYRDCVYIGPSPLTGYSNIGCLSEILMFVCLQKDGE